MNTILKKLLLRVSAIFVFFSFISGCADVSTRQSKSHLRIQSDITEYLFNNFERYQKELEDKTGYNCTVINDEQDYMVFDIDNKTIIKFEIGKNVGVDIIKNELGERQQKQLVMTIVGIDDDDGNAYVDLNDLEDSLYSIGCRYKCNDLETPIKTLKENEGGIDGKIKKYVGTQELEELLLRARSIYSVFEEIADEYNESIEENS